MNISNSVWVVTYQNVGEYPVVTAFDNDKAAYDCYEYFRSKYDRVIINEVPIYKDFIVHM